MRPPINRSFRLGGTMSGCLSNSKPWNRFSRCTPIIGVLRNCARRPSATVSLRWWAPACLFRRGSQFGQTFCGLSEEFSKLSALELEKLLAESAFEEGVDRLTANMNPRLFDERIEHNLRVYDANDICGAVCFLPELFPQTVLTTNLDDLLEHLYFGAGRTFAHVLEGSRIVEYRKLRAESESVLLKLHGDCRNRNNRVLGTAEYVSAYGPGGTIREELALVYRTRTVLCLGCSLGSDRTVRLLREVAESDTNMPKHYAFLQMPEPEAKRLEREHFLTERDIFPIWYQDDHDKSIRALLVGLLRHLGKF